MAARDVRAAGRIRVALASALLSLEEFPERGVRSADDESLRELKAKFGRCGYFIQYEVRGEEVFVARIFHSREER